MKFILMISSLFLYSILGLAQNGIPENKEYSIIVSESCKSFKDGGCLVTTYNVLKFEKDSVAVNYYTKADCESAERNSYYNDAGALGKYSYQIQKKKSSPNHIVRINGYRFGSLEVFPDYLIVINPDHTTNSEYIFNLIE
ncbi:hypothetical protein CLV62_11884 [Dysgonomonas alginatilytica]|uniref:Uncharacterized protein n=1 Tax=Dysgonomonas alginatilytica TaxID=1605892 RepID=A0A2V3PLI1_9BACT|nr:hypothetical protein [Dysgonomonas alginatilytica]PXV62695.1 hypothetical protein CLV62_11884 [Dysgonomonas alginatilytica]